MSTSGFRFALRRIEKIVVAAKQPKSLRRAAMLFFFAALEHLDVTVASVSLYLVPIFGVLMAAVLLGERLSTLALVGSGIVLVATILIMKYDTSY